MENKIPTFCISNLNKENEKFIDTIKCHICGGILYEPIFVKIDKYIACRKCFFNKYKINADIIERNKSEYLYEIINIKNLQNLFKFKYFCPLCKSNNSNNKEYEYDALINHLKICENQILFKDLCRCTNIIKLYLKDVNMNNEGIKIILENKILEKEIEIEKLNFDKKKFQNYIVSEQTEKIIEKYDKIKKRHIKKKFIGTKRINK